MKELNLRNDSLEILSEMLEGAVLKGTVSRMRTRFLMDLSSHIEKVKAEHMQIIKDYAILDNNGEPVIENENYKLKMKTLRNLMRLILNFTQNQ